MPNMKRTEINEAWNRLQGILIGLNPDKTPFDFVVKHEIEKVMALLPVLNKDKRGRYIR